MPVLGSAIIRAHCSQQFTTVAVRALLAVVLAFLFASSLASRAASVQPDGSSRVSYTRDVRPILVQDCFTCHGQDDKARKADLRLDDPHVATTKLPSGETAIVPGEPAKSALVTRIFTEDESEVMPPPETKRKLSAREKDLLKTWIAQGAKYERHWSLNKPADVVPPTVQNSAWCRNDIDRFILRAQEDRGLTPAPEADRRTLIRRLYFDLTGLPPSPEDIQAFVNNKSPAAYDSLVDKLLASPRYGERWARFWLDLARYADTAGYEGDPEYPHAWRYRDYVIDAFNNDKPYDQFIREQLAGDEMEQIHGAGELPLPPAENVVALTFLRLAPFTEPRGDETRDLMLSEMTSTVGSVFLGLTVGCAKCHDHKYDQIPTKDFYRLKAFFSTIQIAPPERGDIFQIGGPQAADFYRPGEKKWTDEERARLEIELPAKLANRSSLEKQLKEKVMRARKVKNTITPEQFHQALDDPNDTTITAKDRAEWYAVAFEVAKRENRLKRLRPAAMSLRHTFGPPYEPGVPQSFVLIRGDFSHQGEAVQPGFLSAITGNQQPARIQLDPFARWPTRGWRKTLADWIASTDNPLTARVMVNRLWQHHYGGGIVATESDFGTLGSPPTHPELLDWLARRFVAEKWSIKKIQRQLVTSAAYRQTSRPQDAEGEKIDPQNRLLWRFRRHRLEGEAVRDSILAASGRLNLDRVGGLAIFPPLPPEMADVPQVYNRYRWDSSDEADGRRRSIYIFQQRAMNLPLLDAFDALVSDSSCARRHDSVTALQSLVLLNGQLATTEAQHLAKRIEREAGTSVDAQIRRAFQLTLAREPATEELARMKSFLADGKCGEGNGLAGICRVLFNSNEFIYVD